jgi:hypothetical protein
MPGAPTIEITSDKTSYLQGEPIKFDVYVVNSCPWRVFVTNNVANWVIEKVIYASLVADFPLFSGFSYPPLSKNKIYTETWDQTYNNGTQVPSGNYTFFYSLGGSVDGRCTVEIKP